MANVLVSIDWADINADSATAVVYDASTGSKYTKTISTDFGTVFVASDYSVTVAEDLVYTGETIEASDIAVVKDYAGSDVTFAVDANIKDAGAYNQTITIEGDGQDNVEIPIEFTVAKADMGTALKIAGLEESYSGTEDEIEEAIVGAFVNGYVELEGAEAGTFTDVNDELKRGTDYTIMVTVSGNQGKVVVAATDACKNFTGSIEAAFAVGNATDIATNATVKFDADVNAVNVVGGAASGLSAYYQNGAEVKAKPTVTVGGTVLTEGVDYTLSWTYVIGTDTEISNKTKVTVTGINAYTGMFAAEYTIVEGAKATIAVQPQEWTGSAVTLTKDDIAVFYNGETVDPKYWSIDSDGYDKNTNVGKEAVVTIEFTAGSPVNPDDSKQEQTFEIYARDMANLKVNDIADLTYGSAKLETISATYGENDVQIPAGQFTVTIKDSTGKTVENENLAAGEYTAVIAPKGGDACGYAGDAVEASFTVKPADIVGESPTVVFEGNSDTAIDYSGSANEITVNVGDLKEGTDYTVTVANKDGQTVDAKKGVIAAGVYTVKVEGKGNYSGVFYGTLTVNAKTITDTMATFTNGNAVYTGKAIDMGLVVYDGNTKLVAGTDYTATVTKDDDKVASIVDAGEYQVVVAGKGNYAGETSELTFTVNKATVTASMVTVTANDLVYNGLNQASEAFTVVIAGEEVDYSVDDWYTNADHVGTPATEFKDAGTYYCDVVVSSLPDTITNYELPNGGLGTVTVAKQSATIAKYDLSNAVIEGVDATYRAGEQPAADSLKVMFNEDDEATAFVDVELIRSATGGTYTATAKSDYAANFVSGSKQTASFQYVGDGYITAKDITVEDVTYTGKAQEPTVNVQIGTEPLTAGEDYTVSYANNVNAGTATVTVTGKGDYAGTATKTFEISPAMLTDTNVTVEGTTYDADGSNYDIVVKFGDTTLAEGTDYTLTFKSDENEITAADVKNVGEYTVIIEGVGNFEGEVEKNFNVAKMKIGASDIVVSFDESDAVVLADGTSAWVIGKDGATPTVIVTLEGKTLVQYVDEETTPKWDYNVVYAGNKNPGTATAEIMLNDSTNVATSLVSNYVSDKEVTKTFRTIGANDLSAGAIFADDVVYTGEAVVPAVQVNNVSGTALVEGIDYKLTYKNALGLEVEKIVEPGMYTVVATGIGQYVGTIQTTFAVTKTIVAAMVEDVPAQAWTGEQITPAVVVTSGEEVLVEGVDYEVTYGENVDGSGTVTVTGIGDYEGTVEKTFEIVHKTFSDIDGHWGKSFIERAASAGWVNGVGENAFEPDGTLTRAMAVTILYRAAGEPTVEGQAPFADVASDDYYANAVAWAVSEGIVNGTTATTFSPDSNVTREQLAKMVALFAASEGVNITGASDEAVKECADYEQVVASFASEFMTWTAANGIMGGKDADGTLVMDPAGTATRAEMCKIVATTVDLIG